MAISDGSLTRPFRFDARFRLPALVFGVRDGTAAVRLSPHGLDARFGPWRVRTPVDNIAGVGVSGPYSLPKTIGPAHVSLADGGLTFATNAELGTCFTFHRPVRGLDPLGLVHHPGLTVTVDDPEAMAETAMALGIPRTDGSALRLVRDAEDELHTLTASELRDLARERGISHPASMKKADLVALLDEQLDRDLVEELTGDDR